MAIRAWCPQRVLVLLSSAMAACCSPFTSGLAHWEEVLWQPQPPHQAENGSPACIKQTWGTHLYKGRPRGNF